MTGQGVACHRREEGQHPGIDGRSGQLWNDEHRQHKERCLCRLLQAPQSPGRSSGRSVHSRASCTHHPPPPASERRTGLCGSPRNALPAASGSEGVAAGGIYLGHKVGQHNTTLDGHDLLQTVQGEL